MENEKINNISTLYNLWIGNNVTKKGLEDVIKNLSLKHSKPEVTQNEVTNNWNKLAALKLGN